MVTPALARELASEIKQAAIYTAISRQGVLFLWPIILPEADGKWNPWHRSAHDGAEEAMKEWVRLTSYRAGGYYDVFVALGNFPEPSLARADL